MDEQKLIRRRNKAVKENNENLLISVCTDLAKLYMDKGKYDFAIEEYTKIAQIYKKQKKMLEYGLINREIGEAYLGLQKYNIALRHQKIHLDMARELKDKLEEQRALAGTGHIYLTNYLDQPEEANKTHLKSAYKFFMASLKLCESFSENVSKLEVADMSARLLSNLGVVQDCLGNYDKAVELIEKSINLCKVHDIYEQLHRGHISLASLLEKRGNHNLALQHYNLAVETAKKIRDQPILLATALLSKSEVLVKLGDFNGAKNTLLKAYKLKISNAKEQKTIEKNLRVVAAMCNYENKLLVTDDNNYKELKFLYEKMGDSACQLKFYKTALDYYKKMLDAAKKAGLSGSELASCYYSLGETCRDDGNYKTAVEYFEMELEFYSDSLKDNLNTLSTIADVKETDNRPVSEVQALYNKALENCRKFENVHEEGRMLKRYIAYLRRQNKHSEAFDLERDLDNLNYHSSDSEGDSSATPASSEIGADIDLNALTDLSDDSDVDQSTAKRPRRRATNFLIKRNNKGETQLHTACIQGKLNVVRHLIDLGHPVNVRDNCGWLPLHEACIHGRLDIVDFLLKKGAAINDRGGTQCGGVTPLHDAASNGHLLIIQLLLDRGANVVAKTDDGDTVLTFLKQWRSRVQLIEEYETLYQSIVDQISQALDKADVGSETKPTSSVFDTKQDLRRSITVGLEEENSSESHEGADDYKNVMQNLRRSSRTTPQKTRTSDVIKRPALVEADAVIDDWLEDDLGKSCKKRKTDSPLKVHKSPVVRKVDDVSDFGHYYYDPNTPSTSRGPVNSPVKSYTTDVETTPNKFKKRKKQAKLTNFGHSRTFVEADSTSQSNKRSPKSAPSPIPKFRSFDNCQQMIDPTLSVDVKINNKLYRVPVLLSQVNTHTIKWLAEEAASRCAKKEYMKPTLELQTQNGAILADDDLVSLLFPMGSSQSEQVEARVIKWSVPPLIDRFREACQDMRIIPHQDISQILQELSVILDLSNRGFQGSTLAPLCRALNRQITLLELHLSGNFLNTECVQLLATSLLSMHNLYTLNLSCTGMTSEHLQILTNDLSGENVSFKLADLDLSDNLLNNQSLKSLAILTRYFELKKLNLSYNKFTKSLFSHTVNENLTLNLSQIEELDLSNNDLSNNDIIKFVSWLEATNIKKLDVSKTSVTYGFLRELIGLWMERGNVRIQVLKLSRCQVQDSDVFDLLGLSDALETLDLSYNNDLSSISLRRLLQTEKLLNLDLIGCTEIFKYFTDFCKYTEQWSYEQNQGKTIKLSVDLQKNRQERDYFIGMWKKWYGNSTVIEESSRLLYLSVKK